jgi:hypothetical protein
MAKKNKTVAVAPEINNFDVNQTGNNISVESVESGDFDFIAAALGGIKEGTIKNVIPEAEIAAQATPASSMADALPDIDVFGSNNISDEYLQHQVKKIKKESKTKATTKQKIENIEKVVEITTSPDAAQLVSEAIEKDFDNVIENLEPVPTVKGNVTFRLRTKALPETVKRFVEQVINESKKDLMFRGVDINTINAVNKGQLKSKPNKLTLKTFIFKPDYKRIKVNRQNRFMFSLTDTADEFVVFLQESTKHTSFILSASNFKDKKEMYKQFKSAVLAFYVAGYDVAVNKLTTKAENNPLGNLLIDVAKIDNGRKYSVTPMTVDGETISFHVMTKLAKNNFIKIIVSKDDNSDTYSIGASDALNSAEADHILINNLTLDKLIKKCIPTIEEAFDNTDWSKIFEIEPDMVDYYQNINKLKFARLRNAYLEMFDAITSGNSEIIIDHVLSNREFKELTNRDEYQAEAIIGRTGDTVEWNLIYYYMLINDPKGRSSSTFLENDAYKELKKITNSARAIQQRSKSIRKEGTQKVYSNRTNLFQLEYKHRGQKDYHTYRAKTFDEVVNDTQFLTTSPKFPTSKF